MNRTAYVLTCIILYSAIMLALAWGLWQIMPGISEWAIEAFGLYPVFALVVAFPFVGWSLAYYLNRKDSGSARDP